MLGLPTQLYTTCIWRWEGCGRTGGADASASRPHRQELVEAGAHGQAGRAWHLQAALAPVPQ